MVVGLGNFGGKYEEDRHNIGVKVVRGVGGRFGVDMGKRRGKCEYGKGIFVGGEEVILVRVQGYMNSIGEGLGEVYRFFKISLKDLVVVYDDIDLEFGRIRIRVRGSSGGHNGVKSVMRNLGEDFIRVRLGVGRGDWGVNDHVLSGFSEEEKKGLEGLVGRGVDSVVSVIEESVEIAMNKYNGWID